VCPRRQVFGPLWQAIFALEVISAAYISLMSYILYLVSCILYLISRFLPCFSGLAVCYQRQSVSNNNHNNAEAKPTHAPPSHYPHGHKWNEPYFDLTMPRNITSLVGKSAYLGCRVKHLGNKTVSRVRGDSLNLHWKK